MRHFRRLLVMAGCVAQLVLCQQPSLTADQLEAFARLARRPTVRVSWSEEVGRIDTNRAQAVVVALIVEDAAEVAQMQGIRIDLEEGSRRDQLFTSEAHLDRLAYAMRDVARWMPAIASDETDTPNRCHGSGVFWMQEGHAFSASERVLGDWIGVVVHPGQFHLTDTQAKDFPELLVAARDKLSRPAASGETP